MSLLLIKPGILTTVQDLGRHGYRRFGINPGGAMDQTAVRLINTVLGNAENEAALEMHFPAAEIVFEANAIAAIGGADFSAVLGDKPIENWRPFFAAKGSVLKFKVKTAGNRAYLAIRDGLRVERWLGSSSTNLTAAIGGLDGRRLAAGDHVECKAKVKRQKVKLGRRVSNRLIPRYRSFPTVRVVAGAEFEFLTEAGRDLLLDHDFIVSNNSNRMGFRLTGEPITFANAREFISSAVSFGTIQTLPDGQLIVLMADHQTAGGYPRIAHIISRDLPLLAQLGANDKVAFHLIEQEDAERLAIEFERELNFLRVGCRFQANSWD
jgi:antagonist of KipI